MAGDPSNAGGVSGDEALRRSEARLGRAQKIARMGSYEASFDEWPPRGGGQSYWSAEVFEVLGLDAASDNPTLETLLRITHPEDVSRIWEAMAKPLAQPVARGVFEHRVVGRDGETRVVRHHLEMLRREGGGVTLTGVVQDITEYRRLEEQLLQAQKLEGIGQLAGGVAHDFNNLLTIINGYADLLAKDDELPVSSRESAETILAAGRRAAELTRQLLAFSRRQILQPRVVSLNEVYLDLKKMLERLLGANIELVEALEAELDGVFADAGQLQQVMMNLIVNARDAMPLGGRVTVETRNVLLDGAYVESHPEASPGPHVCFSVTDTGAGMDQETQTRIFEPFFTTKELGRGTGLGLATVYGIVKQSRGFVWVESEVGRGTTMKVYMPRLPGAASPVAQAQEGEPEGQAQGKTVLLVEDQEAVRQFASKVLRRVGYVVVEAASGEEALEAARSAGRPVDVILADVIMPGMTARTLAAELQREWPQARILFTSGYSESVLLHQQLLEPGMEVLAKPFTPGELLRRLEAMLEGGSR
ncbi:MAG: response regulator [Acidobacteria bacterium]|nr:response regulator [Acidobacteriota bacterium]